MTTAKIAIPTGNLDTSVVMLSTTTPAEVYVGEEVKYDMAVTNLTDCTLDDVILTAEIPDNFTFKGSAPQAQMKGGVAQWDLSKLDGKETKTVKIVGVPTQAGSFVSCAKVTYTPICCTSFVAVAPKLTLEKTMPADVLICDDIPIKLVVGNGGTGTIKGAQVVDTLPDGLVSSDGKTQVTFNAGDLAAGQSKTFEMVAKAKRTGTFTNKAVATAGSMKAEDAATVTVRQPVLSITKTGTKTQFSGREVSYDISVMNKGDAPATNLVVEDVLPANMTFTSASGAGTFGQGKVTWTVGSLAPQAKVDFKVTGTIAGNGEVKNTATAVATCAQGVSASAATVVVGKAAILLEVVDEADPLTVGDVETYTITATNQGTAPDTNIKIVCKIEDNEVFVSAGGASNATHANGVVTFAPVASLAPKAEAVWQVKVKGVKVGDVRFSVEMTTDELSRPVKETEATQIY
jgi:uncharacterized repeat protein (TIGR01451 family)